MAGRRSKTADMLNGSLWDKILLFALPLAASNILQQLFNAADVMVVGRFAGSEALAAVGANSPLISLVVGLFGGMSVGTNVVISIAIGQNRENDIQKAVHTSIVGAAICGVFLSIIGVFVARPALTLMSTPADVLDLATLYLKIYSLGMPFILVYNFAAAILRSKGDTRRPLVVLAAAGVVNVILNIIFVVVFRMNVEGVAIATLISNIISAATLVILLMKEEGVLKLQRKYLRVDKDVLMRIAKIGVPAGLQGVVFSVSNIFIQSAMNGIGSSAIAATAVISNYEYVAYYVINAFGQAAVTFIGQNYGAGNWKRSVAIVRWCLALCGIFTILLNVVLVVFSEMFVGFFTEDPAVIELAVIRMRIIMTFEVMNMFIEVLSGVMRGFSYSMTPALICMAGVCGVRLIWLATVFANNPTYTMLLIVYPVSWAVTVTALVIAYFVIKKKCRV